VNERGPASRRPIHGARRRLFQAGAIWLSLSALEGICAVGLGVLPPLPEEEPLQSRDPEWLVNARSAFQRGLFMQDDACLWRPKPGGTFATGKQRIWGSQDLVVNANGHRGPLVPEKKPPGVRRILVLGGSHPFGMWVGVEEMYSSVLQALLDERSPGQWQVLNASCPGHTSYQGWKYLERHGLRFEPDIVIDDLGMNDNLALSVSYARPDREVATVPPWWAHHGAPWLEAHSNTYAFLKRSLAPLRKADGEGRPPVRVSREERAEAIAGMRALGTEHGFQMLFLSQVGVEQKPGGRAICQVTMEEFDPRVEICHVFEDLGPEAWRYFADTIHATAQGHRLIGEATFKKLDELGWIGPTSGP
jgi:lysophospholipase L1-like esterase